MPKLKGIYLRPLGTLTHLKSFSIYRCEDVAPAECDQVDLPVHLTYLQIGRTAVGDENLRRWLEQTQVESLSLDVDCSRAIAPGLAKQTRLKSLQIRNAPLIDEDLLFLKDCPELDMLHLKGLPANGAYLKGIGDDSKLMMVSLNSTTLTDEHAAELRRFSKLSMLDLSWTPVSGAFLAGGSWGKVKHLGVYGTQFSEQGKASLASLSSPLVVEYPGNWTVEDFRRYQGVKPPRSITLNHSYADQGKGVVLPPGTRFAPLQFQRNAIDRCPMELMAPVTRLLELSGLQSEKTEVAPKKD